jgi:hypothetical protein
MNPVQPEDVLLDPMSPRPHQHRVKPVTCQATQAALRDWLPVRDSHPGQELNLQLHRQAEDTSAVFLPILGRAPSH